MNSVIYRNDIGRDKWYIARPGNKLILHREDGPAVIHPDGKQEWYLNGLRHRTDGPAVIRADGRQEWYVNALLHREDGPAVIHPDGSFDWFFKGRRHRLDGPARYIKDDIYNNHIIEEWYVNGMLHREDGPAHSTTTKYNTKIIEEWWIKGCRHNNNGPAIIDYITDNKEWWVNDQLHREDGPAVICQNKHYWYINGFNITDSVNKWFQMQGYEQHMEHLDNEIKIEFLLRFL